MKGRKELLLDLYAGKSRYQTNQDFFCPPQLSCHFEMLVLDDKLILWTLNVHRSLPSD